MKNKKNIAILKVEEEVNNFISYGSSKVKHHQAPPSSASSSPFINLAVKSRAVKRVEVPSPKLKKKNGGNQKFGFKTQREGEVW